MVAHPRKTPGPSALRSIAQDLQFRSLNLPVPIEVVEGSAERPISIILPSASSSSRSRRSAPGQSLMVTAINDLWQVDDEWWRERPISRRYYQVTTQDERRLTIFRDQLNAQWYWQRGE